MAVLSPIPPVSPRIELHLHLDCSLSFGAVKSLFPGLSLAEYRRDFIAPVKCADLVDFLRRPTRMIELMQDAAALRVVTEDLFAQLASDDVAYAEIRFAPLLHTAGGLSAEEVVRVVEAAVTDASAATGVHGRLLLCTLRHYDAEQSLHTARLAAEALGRGVVVGLDIAGDEANFSLDAHEAAFAYAREHGLRITAHAGEARGADSVTETLDRLKAERIGHGIRSIEDDAVIARLVAEDIHLEVCPTSNVQTMDQLVPTYADHAIDRLYHRGVSLSVNTDARTICDVTLAREYDRLRAAFGWTDSQLRACNAAAVRASFAPQALKSALLDRIEAARDA